MSEPTRKTVSFSLPVQVVETLESISSSTHISRSAIVAYLIQKESNEPTLSK